MKEIDGRVVQYSVNFAPMQIETNIGMTIQFGAWSATGRAG